MSNEKIRFADFHQDTANPHLADILSDFEKFGYAQERVTQIPREDLKRIDIIFASLYRRAQEDVQKASKDGNVEFLNALKDDYRKIMEYYKTTKDFRIIEKPDDLLFDSDQTNIVLHLENGDIITSPDVVDELHSWGVRSVGLLYNHDNPLGGGVKGEKTRGLTDLGKKVLRRMMEHGMVVDIAHANEKTGRDILEEVGEYDKAVATHTGVRQDYEDKGKTHSEKNLDFWKNSERLVSPEMIKEIAKKGGVIGFTPTIYFFPTLDHMIKQLKDQSQSLGSVDNLAIATDFGGLEDKDLFTDIKQIKDISVIAEKLSEQGFSDDQIAQIMFGNVKRITDKLGQAS